MTLLVNTLNIKPTLKFYRLRHAAHERASIASLHRRAALGWNYTNYALN